MKRRAQILDCQKQQRPGHAGRWIHWLQSQGFRIKTPALTDLYPNSIGWVVLTLAIGGAFTVLAILGFEKLSRFASVCSPWIFAIFIAGAIATFPAIGVHPNLDN